MTQASAETRCAAPLVAAAATPVIFWFNTFAHHVYTSSIMESSDSECGKKSGKQQKMGRIKKSHLLEMLSWLALDRVYSGGKEGAKQKNIRWCLGGGEKGLKAMVESKEAKSSGAFERMAGHLNRVFYLKGEDAWTRATAEARFKNIMKSFRDACRKHPLPREKDYSEDKNAYATAMEKCEDERKKKCSAYIALWVACGLKDHPKFSRVGKAESAKQSDSSDDFEDETLKSKGARAEAESESTDESSSSDGAVEKRTEASSPKTVTSPRVLTSSPKAAAVKRKGSPRKVVVKKAKSKWALKKGKSTTKHQDIVQAYLECKKQQNDHFLHISIVSQRRGIFFDCWDRGIRNSTDIRNVFQAIGVSEVPHLLRPLVVEHEDDEENDEADENADDDSGKQEDDADF
jgi:hypothetical protein